MLNIRKPRPSRPWSFIGGEGEIRTHDTLSDIAVFKTAALNHSATSPLWTYGESDPALIHAMDA